MSDGGVRKLEDESESASTQILDFIRKHPGTHFREIKRQLNLAMGTVQYHLYRLERNRRILSRRRGLYKRFYPVLMFGDEQLEILDVLSQETERDILLFLIHNPSATQREVANHVQVSPASTNWHMNRLSEARLVEVKRDGANVRYNVRGNSAEILSLVKNYHPLVWERWADRLADILLDMSDNSSEGTKIS